MVNAAIADNVEKHGFDVSVFGRVRMVADLKDDTLRCFVDWFPAFRSWASFPIRFYKGTTRTPQ